MKVGFLGAGTWGFCLAVLLANKGNRVVSWVRDPAQAEELNRTHQHPKLEGDPFDADLLFTTDLQEVLEGIDLLCESVTSAGVRKVFEAVRAVSSPMVPIVITSKGIEQDTGLLLPDLVSEVLGEESRKWIGCLSGPSHAEEVVQGLPTTVVGSSYDGETTKLICDAFTTPSFRVYPNSDINGVAFGGAMKNIIAIGDVEGDVPFNPCVGPIVAIHIALHFPQQTLPQGFIFFNNVIHTMT